MARIWNINSYPGLNVQDSHSRTEVPKGVSLGCPFGSVGSFWAAAFGRRPFGIQVPAAWAEKVRRR